jgi:hypothetical protein
VSIRFLSVAKKITPDKNYDVDGVMSKLIRYNRKPETFTEEIVNTVLTISEIIGKSIKTQL